MICVLSSVMLSYLLYLIVNVYLAQSNFTHCSEASLDDLIIKQVSHIFSFSTFKQYIKYWRWVVLYIRVYD